MWNYGAPRSLTGEKTGSLSNKISKIENKIQELKQKQESGNIDKKKVKEIQKDIIDLMENEVQTAMTNSVKKLRKYIEDEINEQG